MNKEDNHLLLAKKQEIIRLEKIEYELPTLKESLEKTEKQREIASSHLIQKEKDYKRLNEKSLFQVFYSLIGCLDEQLQSCKKEVIEAGGVSNQLNQQVASLKEQIESMETEKHQYHDVYNVYEQLHKRKKEYLLQVEDQIAHEIRSYDAKIEIISLEQQHLKETLEIGERLVNSLEEVISTLYAAEGWSFFDVIGGGLISGIFKGIKLEKAKKLADGTQIILTQYKSRLLETTFPESLKIDVSEIMLAIDMIFDCIVTDLITMKKLVKTQEELKDMQKKIEDSLKVIENQIQGCSEKQNQLNKAQNEYILNV